MCNTLTDITDGFYNSTNHFKLVVNALNQKILDKISTYLLHEVFDLGAYAQTYQLKLANERNWGDNFNQIVVIFMIRCCRSSWTFVSGWGWVGSASVLAEVLDEEAPLILRNHLEVTAHHQAYSILHHVIEVSVAGVAGQQVQLGDGLFYAKGDASVR